MAGHVAVIIAQRGEVLLQVAHVGAGGAQLQAGRAGRGSNGTARRLDRILDRGKRLRARHAVRRQAVILLEGLDRGFGLGTDVAGDVRVVIAQLLEILLEPGDAVSLAVELDRRAGNRSRRRRAAGHAAAHERLFNRLERLGARHAVGRQVVLLLEELHRRLGLGAEAAGDVRPVVTQRLEVLLQIAHVRTDGAELQAGSGRRGRGRRRGGTPLGVNRFQLGQGRRADDAVDVQTICLLEGLDRAFGLRADVAGALTVIISQSAQHVLHTHNSLLIVVLGHGNRARGHRGAALRGGERAHALARQAAAAYLEGILGLLAAENLDEGIVTVALADPAGADIAVAVAVLNLDKGDAAAGLGTGDIDACVLHHVVDDSCAGRCARAYANLVLRLAVNLAVTRGKRGSRKAGHQNTQDRQHRNPFGDPCFHIRVSPLSCPPSGRTAFRTAHPPSSCRQMDIPVH